MQTVVNRLRTCLALYQIPTALLANINKNLPYTADMRAFRMILHVIR